MMSPRLVFLCVIALSSAVFFTGCKTVVPQRQQQQRQPPPGYRQTRSQPAPQFRPVRAKPAPGRPGFVVSPYVKERFIDVRGVPSGVVIRDPYTGKPVLVP